MRIQDEDHVSAKFPAQIRPAIQEIESCSILSKPYLSITSPSVQVSSDVAAALKGF